ncbi:GNAT family N-acetyltransferase [Streptomyces sp. H27-H1]|uniref:GNAT family N-acetyltransferase n=1 Tax=Streptomyces sp. H27-H1 TaxID=2996461 RepID=UPI002271BA1B|nr:GNAT family N-acetyltransferase [Streptomyces sp. H27-H1]MCY0928888.1 GNAT family N-acetyltransferase [Streptomyces sp. H27-H1]
MILSSLHDRSALATRFERDPAMHVMELGDLDDLLWPHTSWYTVSEGGPVALLYSVGDVPTLLGFTRPGQASALEDLAEALLPVLPRHFFGHLTGNAAKVLESAYTVRPHGTLLRMALTEPDRADRYPAGPWQPAPLGRGDLPELLELFTQAYPGNWFDHRMLDTGQYVGVRQAGRLVAVAGVHVHSATYRVAAIGNVATHPRVRGQGAGGACVAELCRRLGKSVEHIGLNVRADNATAVRLYRRLGFSEVTEFTEASFTARPRP